MAELTPQLLQFNPDVQQALQAGTPVVALETTVITHGLPFPQNLQLAQNVESEVRSQGSLPATIGILDGVIKIGMEQRELEKLIHQENLHKLSSRDLGAAVALGWSGGTTVAGTIAAAELAGIRTFATGGIGGVHRGSAWDVSADLIQLAKTPVLVVCSGAKSILNLPATLEFLETHCVPVIGYQTDEFPAFYSKSSGLKVSARVDSPEQAARIATSHWSLGGCSAVLLCVPVPDEDSLEENWIESIVRKALRAAEKEGIRGPEVTPYLLQQIADLTGQRSLQANLSLLRNNARVAGMIAPYL